MRRAEIKELYERLRKEFLMKSKSFVALVVVVIMVLYLSKFNEPSTQIQKDILDANGYLVSEITKNYPLEIFIKPEWIPLEDDKKLNLNVKLLEIENTTIYLQEVWNRGDFGDDIYFSFHTTYNLDSTEGRFLNNNVYNQDGSVSTDTSFDDFLIYDSKKNEIVIGETGTGPGSDFSFGVDESQFIEIRNGFYLNYSGMHLYEYSKK
ncbi:hypothetical protein [uncultured Paenibacillus sp.]|uniref:hypothetical protein n=1 Tax=uncultured Paenibacillus sp. TaxID=227322 RepID=UPI0015A7CF62|nr:hypothetical protein [uncultured Paenibacillus sp.]